MRIWAHGGDTKASVVVKDHTTVGDACVSVRPLGLLYPPQFQTYLVHGQKRCFLQAVSTDALLKDSIHDFPLDKNGDRSMSLFTLHVIYPESNTSRL